KLRVHEAVLENNEKESGISVHLVNEVYDAGDVVFQTKCSVEPDDTPESLAERVHKLEYEFYPKVIEDLLNGID
ncbi:MAG: phosphoribosylglycinamide formyltransferase, partial [Bacteroidetes bacterium]|nr:phosphoribosylglycinamide formyltransferase [Bacteroidota bacterium]